MNEIETKTHEKKMLILFLGSPCWSYSLANMNLVGRKCGINYFKLVVYTSYGMSFCCSFWSINMDYGVQLGICVSLFFILRGLNILSVLSFHKFAEFFACYFTSKQNVFLKFSFISCLNLCKQWQIILF